MQFALSKFPLSPSVNQSLRPMRSTGRLVKTKEMQLWEKHVLMWSLRYCRELDKIKDWLKVYDGPLSLSIQFVFHKPRILKKDGKIKMGRNDPDNFLKNTKDALSKLLGIDDARFNFCSVERILCENEADQQTLLTITPIEIKLYDKR